MSDSSAKTFQYHRPLYFCSGSLPACRGAALVKISPSWYAFLFHMVFAIILFCGCATVPGRSVGDNVTPLVAKREISENRLLDCSIRVFDPGTLPDDPDARKGLSMEIRDAESRFIPVHLKKTMQRTGYWGVVRVVPDDDVGADLLVRGKVEYSDGETLSVTIEAVDARNVTWFKKTYKKTVKPDFYLKTELEKRDAFQDLYNTVANDLATYMQRLTPEEIKEIKEISSMRFASYMAPDAFGDCLVKDRDGRFHLAHLPAQGDPMMRRVESIRARDRMLVDMINGYYDSFYSEMWQPYNDWRHSRDTELTVMHEIERQAFTREAIGIASVVGAIVLALVGSRDVVSRTSTLRNVMVMGGAAAIYSGYEKKKEAEMNKAAIEELGASFSSEAKPLVMDVEGHTVRLTGSAREQYRRWRQILKEIYARETGLPVDTPAKDTSHDKKDGLDSPQDISAHGST